MSRTQVRTGLAVLRDQGFAPLRGLRVGLVTHPAAVDEHLRHAAELFAEAPGVRLATLFGPEHGFEGTAQDLIGVADGDTPSQGPRVVSLYGATEASLHPTDQQLDGLDALVLDLQDIGTRYYTFQATMLYCLEAAARRKLLTVVLDRPNPLGGVAIEGPGIDPGYESFVGPHPIPTRHGLTLGELARLYQAERNLGGELRVIPCEGWRREHYDDETGLPWVMPSPNMPTPATALVYPGQCLMEGTNLSEGRGTTRPFELCGAPWLDAGQAARRLNDANLPGVTFRPAWFQPTFHKFAGQRCGGIQIHVRDRDAFRPLRTGLTVLAVLRELSGARFAWRTETYEFVQNPIAIDLLFGSGRERSALEAGQSPAPLADAWVPQEQAFATRRQPALLY